MKIKEYEFMYITFTQKRAYIKLRDKPIQELKNDLTISSDEDYNFPIKEIYKIYKEMTNKFISIIAIEKHKYLPSFFFKITNESSTIRWDQRFIYKININYNDCLKTDIFRFVYGHELGHFFVQYPELEIEKKSKLINYSLIFSKFIINNVINIFCITVIALMISLNLFLIFEIKLFYEILLTTFLLNIKEFKKSFLYLAFNIKNLKKIINCHNIEILCDKFSVNRFNSKINKFFNPKILMICLLLFPEEQSDRNSISHPNSLLRILNVYFNKNLIIPVLPNKYIESNPSFLEFKENIKKELLLNKYYQISTSFIRLLS